MALLVRVEARAADPMLHPGLWRNRVVVGANVATVAASIGMLGLIYFFGLFAQSAAGFDSPAAGVAAALVPFTLSIIIFVRFSELLARRLGTWGPVLTGLGLAVLGFGWLSTTTAGTTEAQLIAPLALCGVGAGIANGGLTGVAVLTEGRDRLDEAAGLLSLSRFIGSALAIAIGTSTYLSVAAARLPLDPAAGTPTADEVAVGGSAFKDAVAQLRQDLRAPFEAAARSRTAEAFASTMRIAAIVVLVLTLLSVWLLLALTTFEPRAPSSSEAEDLGGGLAEQLDVLGVVAVGRQVAGEAVDAELEHGRQLLAHLVGVAPGDQGQEAVAGGVVHAGQVEAAGAEVAGDRRRRPRRGSARCTR